MAPTLSSNIWRVLLIDAYDSFTNNLAQLVRQEANAPTEIHIVKNDALTKKQFLEILPSFDVVVVGPGPGSPANPADMGFTTALWELPEELLLPVFGVCLGMQSMALSHGGSIHRLQAPQHGRLAPITHDGTDIFENVEAGAIAVRYHSLHVTPSDVIKPLAWVTDIDDGKVLMAARHISKPFWGVQYHPESICTSEGAASPIGNFFHLARKWLDENKREQAAAFPSWFFDFAEQYPVELPTSRIAPPTADSKVQVQTSIIEGSTLSAPQIAEFLGVTKQHDDFIMLDAAANPGRFSIIAAVSSDSPRIEHFCGDEFVTIITRGIAQRESLRGSTVWSWLEGFMKSRPSAIGGAPDLPFWGGLMGSFSYEAGVEAIQIEPLLADERSTPDVNLIFVQRSVVLDNHASKIYVQSIRERDAAWVYNTREQLSKFSLDLGDTIKHEGSLHIAHQELYKERVRECQEFLAAGETYELCLTATAKVHLKPTAPEHHKRSWNFYRRLRARNPAPYAAYFRLGGTTFVGSSPERFLSWDRNGRSELRPIKGTVKKSPDGSVTRADAEKILRTDKEMAENLMIVDLIRHDLHGRAVADTVTVSQLMGIEEYERVFQLVSVIEGKVDLSQAWDLLRTSLPPGSMTGAPKKRSVEILQRLEGVPRGVYSGVVGYWCAGGGADWSVVIRSCVNTGKVAEDGADVWTIGAGGAITILSDPLGEYEEMQTKLGSVLSALG